MSGRAAAGAAVKVDELVDAPGGQVDLQAAEARDARHQRVDHPREGAGDRAVHRVAARAHDERPGFGGLGLCRADHAPPHRFPHHTGSGNIRLNTAGDPASSFMNGRMRCVHGFRSRTRFHASVFGTSARSNS